MVEQTLDVKDRCYIWDWFATNYQDFTRHICSTAKDIFEDGSLFAWEIFSRKDEVHDIE